MASYHVYGRAFAGSLIVEFMLREAGLDYTISFPNDAERASPEYRAKNPTGKIPVLTCPNGGQVFETLAIVQYLSQFCPHLLPVSGSAAKKHIYLFCPCWERPCIRPITASITPINMGPRQHGRKYKAARAVNDELYDYIEGVLNPYICGEMLTPADLYLYMISRWNLDKDAMRAKKLASALDRLHTPSKWHQNYHVYGRRAFAGSLIAFEFMLREAKWAGLYDFLPR